jgi:hypothetical protein
VLPLRSPCYQEGNYLLHGPRNNFFYSSDRERKLGGGGCDRSLLFRIAREGDSNQLTPWNGIVLEKAMEIFRLLRNTKVHYCVNKSPPLVPILSQMNSGHTLPSYFPKIHSNIIFPYRWATGWITGGSNHGRRWEIFSSPPRPDRLWDPTSQLSNGYQGLIPWGKATGAWSWPVNSF